MATFERNAYPSHGNGRYLATSFAIRYNFIFCNYFFSNPRRDNNRKTSPYECIGYAG